jgi:hypothetical protein
VSHWAEIDNTNTVIRVLAGDNNDPAGDEGYQWLIDNLGGTWIKTSYNGSIRYNYAGIGYTYDATRDAFIAPKPFNSWVLDEATYRWQAPTSYPTTEGKTYYWSEDDLTWREITND